MEVMTLSNKEESTKEDIIEEGSSKETSVVPDLSTITNGSKATTVNLRISITIRMLLKSRNSILILNSPISRLTT